MVPWTSLAAARGCCCLNRPLVACNSGHCSLYTELNCTMMRDGHHMSCSQTLLLLDGLNCSCVSFVQGEERRDRRRVRRLHTVTLRTPLTTALRLLLESGCSSLPVLDEVWHLLEAPV